MEDRNEKKSRIDQQWFAKLPKGWGTWSIWDRSANKQERADREMHRGEREMLYELIDSGEDIQALVGGVYRAEGSTKGNNGVAVATNRRVIFVDKGILGSTEVSEISYDRIEGLTHSTGMMYGGIQILGVGGTGWRIEMVEPKHSARLFADEVRTLVESNQASHISHDDDKPKDSSSADELRKWAELHKDGVITQYEFNEKKKQLLGI